jgi:phosphopantetheinyl transferase
VRLLLKDLYRVDLCPADIEIATDQYGYPTVRGALIDKLDCRLSLSIAHTGEQAVAIVGECGDERGVGIDVEPMGRNHPGLESGALTTQEQALLFAVPVARREEWWLRLWCAKEALAKAIGRGMAGHPFNLMVQQIDMETGRVTLALAGELARQFPASAYRLFTAYTGCEDALVFATSLV